MTNQNRHQHITSVFAVLSLLSCTILQSTCATPIPDSSTTGNGNQTKIIAHSPKDEPIIYKEGSSLSLSCFARSTKGVQWKWQRNGMDVRSGDGYVSSKANDNTNRANQTSQVVLTPVTDLESNFTCVAVNRLGESSHTFTIKKYVEEKETPQNLLPAMVGLSTLSGVVLVTMCLILIYFRVKSSRPPLLLPLDKDEMEKFLLGSCQSSEKGDGVDLADFCNLRYDHRKEIKMEKLVIGRYVGGGISGRVEAAILVDWPEKNEHKQVAIKSVRKDRTMTQEQFELAFLDFIHKEIKISQLVGSFGSHENVVGYVGSVIEDLSKYKAYLVVEYCSGGDLATLLKKHRDGGTFLDDYDTDEPDHHGNQDSLAMLKKSDLIKWAEQIATGMEYLASKHIPHMDLATRNILLAHENLDLNTERYLNPDPANLTAKISDLGMARELTQGGSAYYQLYYPDEPEKNKNARWLPLRWMSIEALETFKFSLESDKWALGVTYWEMFTLGDFPYKDIINWSPGITEEPSALHERNKLMEYFRSGGILPQPEYAPPQIWDIMMGCWNLNPEERPSLSSIRKELQGLNEDVKIHLQGGRSMIAGSNSSSSTNYVENVEYTQIQQIEQIQEVCCDEKNYVIKRMSQDVTNMDGG